MHIHNPPPGALEEKIQRQRQVSFVIEEKKHKVVAPVKPKPSLSEKQQPVIRKEPIDLTKAPKLDQKIEDTHPDNTLATNQTPVRRVYGLRRVYSMGIGEGGAASEAIIGKLGNTITTDIDTAIATKKDITGTLVPVTAVTTPPQLIKSVKPGYTKEMIQSRVEGVVKAQLLIDGEGKVKDVRILSDVGFQTGLRAREAFLQWLFEPAKRGAEMVSVWMTFAIRFVLQD